MKIKNAIFNLLTYLSLIVCLSLQQYAVAQTHSSVQGKIIRIPFEASRFDTSQRKAEFLTYKGVHVMKILPFSSRQTRPILLKDFNFTNGTIEFDARPVEGNYTDEMAINFHQKDNFNFESLYLRTQENESVQRDDAIQYTPVISSVNLWDVMTPFRGYALIHNKDWNHFKLIISGAQMLVYINSRDTPALVVSRLEGNYAAGGISFDGEAIFANLVIRPDQTEGLSPAAGFDLTDNDPNYIRRWQVSYPRKLDIGQQLTEDDLPGDTVKWMPITAERRGLINLYRKFESTELTSYPVNNRYVWLKTVVKSSAKQTVKVDFGYSKEVYVFINKRLLYEGKNEAGQRYAKNPGGRIAVTNATIEIPLNQGDNEIIIGIAAPLYGWGIMARVESLTNLNIAN